MATKLELIQQNRASWMSYLDAAKKATQSLDVNSDANRLARLEASWQGWGRAAQNLQAKSATSDFLSSVDALTSWLSWDISATESGNPDAPISTIAAWTTWAKTVSQLASVVSPTAQAIWPTATRSALTSTPQSTSNTTNSQGNSSTITWGSFWVGSNGKQTTQQVAEWQTNRVLWDAVNNYDTNNTLDRTQYEQQKIAAEAKAMETDTELKRFQMEKEQLAQQEDANQKLAAQQEASNMKALQEKERAANEASVAAAQAKADAAERELQIANDIELQKSNVAFAKMGLTLSTAAVTSAQQIYTTWIYNLSKLKSENAFQLADLQVAVAKVEFDHTKVINDIINKSSDKSYEIRKKLNDDIHTIKNSIIDNRFERQKNIDKAIDTYQEAISNNEEEVLNKMNKANAVLQWNVDAFYSSLKVSEWFNQNKIDKYVESWMWGKLTPAERTSLERKAWIQPWTTDSWLRGTVVQSLMKELSDIPWLSSWELSQVSEEAMRLINTWVQKDLAIQMALRQNPKYLQSLVKKTKWSGSSWSSSSTATQYTRQVYQDKESNLAYNLLFDKKTWQYAWAELITVPELYNKTSYDTKWWLAAAWESFMNWWWIAWAVIAWLSQANKWATTTQAVRQVPLKPNAVENNPFMWGATQ